MTAEPRILEGAQRLHAVAVQDGWSVRVLHGGTSLEIGTAKNEEQARRFLSRFPTAESEGALLRMHGLG